MKIHQTNHVVELSYKDILSGLYQDIQSDTCIPDLEKKTIENHLFALDLLLEKYSY